MLIYDNLWANLSCFSFDSPSFTSKIPSSSNLVNKIVHAIWLCNKKVVRVEWEGKFGLRFFTVRTFMAQGCNFSGPGQKL